jgi:hypothetical protein
MSFGFPEINTEISFHLPPHRFRISNSEACLFQVEVTGRAKLDKTGKQVTATCFGFGDSVMDHGSVAALTAKLWECGGIGEQADPILHE